MRVRHDDDGSVITVDMPGVDENDIELTFKTGSAMRTTLIRSRRISSKGVLTVKAAKRPEAKPRKILLGGKRSQKQLAG